MIEVKNLKQLSQKWKPVLRKKLRQAQELEQESDSKIAAYALTLCRRHRVIVPQLDFCAHAGEVTVIVGPNGSGKSTLLAALAGELPYQGHISINGQNMAKLKPARLATMRAVLPQGSQLSFPFLVREVVALGQMRGGRCAPLKNLPELALERVDLAGFGGRFYQELSGGEQARVQLARILTQIWQPVYEGKPCWLLLDEPVAALDIQHQLIVMDIARNFARDGGGVIAILHDLNLATCYADKMLLLDEGRIVAEGKAEEVLTTQNLKKIYHCDIQVGQLPPQGQPFILPQSRENPSPL